MNIKELKSKVRELQNEAASLETVFDNAAIKYLDTVVGVASCNSDDKDGKVAAFQASGWQSNVYYVVLK